uniref:N-myc downstream regulated 1b n=1 Tax=Scleropages formosus TaxID=113540 RepID=A0A8C9QXT1_SCLFO
MVLEGSELEAVFDADVAEHEVETPQGRIHCTMKGVSRKNQPAILTFHDIGLNHKTCFSSLFHHEDMQEITQHFAVCHVDAPGQQEGARTLSTGYNYPSMDQLSDAIPYVIKHFGLSSVIGMGMGAGAYILAKFALNYPELVEGLILININVCAEGWMDWATQKITGWTNALPDMVIDHLFAKEEIQNNPNLVETYRQYITNDINQTNLQHFVRSYNSRRDLEIERSLEGENMNVRTLTCPSLLVVGDSSPAVEAVVSATLPGKLTEALKYFIQGMGYMPWAGMTRLVRSRTASAASLGAEDKRSRSNTGEQGPRARAHTDTSMESATEHSNHYATCCSLYISCL